MSRTRRSVLGTVAGVVSLAGCTGYGGSTGETEASDESGTTDGDDGSESGIESARRLPDHPSLNGLAAQPTLGTEPGAGEGMVVAFEDPSCGICARFENNDFPQLKAELLDTGRATFVFRGTPIVYPWGEPASHALEATYDRSASAHWALKNHYYGNQGQFDTDNVFDLTETFLAEHTALDAAAVVDDAESGGFQDAVDADLAAADELGVSSTPTFYTFDSGEFSTEITGAAGYATLKGAMGIE